MVTDNFLSIAYSVINTLLVAFVIVAGQFIENRMEASLVDIWLPLSIIACIGVMLVLIGAFVSLRLAAMIPLGVFLVFFYEPLRTPTERLLKLFVYNPGFLDGAIAIGVLVLIWTLIVVFIWNKKAIDTSRGLCGIMVIIAIITGVTSVVYAGYAESRVARVAMPNPFKKASQVTAESQLLDKQYPDIIYVVPDRYPSAKVLDTRYSFNNIRFYNNLQRLGFSVNSDARANYPKTFQSLASMFYGSYLEPFKSTFGPRWEDHKPVYRAIHKNPVVRELKNLGYRYVHIGNWWAPTKSDKRANVVFDREEGYFKKLLDRKLTKALWQLTPGPGVSKRLFSAANDKCQVLKRQFKMLRNVGNKSDQPTFVFAHIFIPHSPITMNESADCLESELCFGDVGWSKFKNLYINYLQAFNKEILDVIRAQKEMRQGTSREFVFVIQSDEGPFPKSMRRGEKEFNEFCKAELRQKLGIINAMMYTAWDEDSKGRECFLKQETPINNWRIIFNEISDTEIPLLNNERTYVYPKTDEGGIFDFRDITHVFNRATHAY